jgi:cytochrome c556
MTPAFRTNLTTILGCLVIAGASAALAQGLSGAGAVHARQEGFKLQGAAFKVISDQLKTPAPDVAAIRTAANTVNHTADVIQTWFPAGSGAEAGVPTRARPEIWTDQAHFAAAMAAFRAQAPRLKAAADSGNVDNIRTEFMATGRTCGGCHIPFRAPEH